MFYFFTYSSIDYAVRGCGHHFVHLLDALIQLGICSDAFNYRVIQDGRRLCRRRLFSIVKIGLSSVSLYPYLEVNSVLHKLLEIVWQCLHGDLEVCPLQFCWIWLTLRLLLIVNGVSSRFSLLSLAPVSEDWVLFPSLLYYLHEDWGHRELS